MTTSTPTLQEKARRLRTLHDESRILVLGIEIAYHGKVVGVG
ncbi:MULTISPECIES: hypothetical protein [Micromonospora]|nr:hypothetical protein [Micromonospora sp. M61]WTI18645.1 hypothetical protein OG886_16655 [Micromonospora zamorensis]